MPVPKGKQKLYGKVVGKNMNEGKSVDAAKAIADRAVKPGKARKAKAKKVTKRHATK